jgi:hypothetical protein
LEANLFELTRPSDAIQLPGAPLRTVTGDSIARIPNVASWFTATWSALRFQREQAWHRAKARISVGANPAEIMVLWGLGAIESLVTTAELWGGDPRSTAELWFAVEITVRESRLVEPRAAKDFWSQAMAGLFRWWPSIFASTPKQLSEEYGGSMVHSQSLCHALAPYIGINADFTAIIVSLQQAGVDAIALDDAVRAAGQDLLHIIRRFVETTSGLEDRRLWNPGWVADLSTIETAIGRHRTTGEKRLSPA